MVDSTNSAGGRAAEPCGGTDDAAWADDRLLGSLEDWLRMPSVSADPQATKAMQAAARWLCERLRRLGCQQVEMAPTPGHPVVVGRLEVAPGEPTVLLYGHYDVQAADGDGWTSPPFEPTVREGRLYARGATDDKGQIHMHLAALEMLVEAGELPVNVVFLIEGEEEIGSTHLEPFVAANAELLRCDAIVISDSDMIDATTGAIVTGFRGHASFDLVVRGPARDLHSGLYGGAVADPALSLARVLEGLIDERGRITIPGLYEQVRPLGEAERRRLAEVPFDEGEFLSSAGVESSTGEAGYSVLERVWCRPSLDVHALAVGTPGRPVSTVVPERASARLSLRLVPDQDPRTVLEPLRTRVSELLVPGTEAEVTPLTVADPWSTDPERPLYEHAARALEVGFGSRPVFARGGGSLPIVPMLESLCEAPVLLLGFGLPGSNPHGPDEWLDLGVMRRGIVALTSLYRSWPGARPADDTEPADVE